MQLLLLSLIWAVASEARTCPHIALADISRGADSQAERKPGPNVLTFRASSAQKPPSDGTSRNTAARSWKVEYQESGGIGGINRHVTLSNDGTLVREDSYLRQKAPIISHVSARQIVEVSEILIKLKKAGVPKPGPQPSFPDAMFFTLTITFDGKEYPADPANQKLARLRELMVSMLDANHGGVRK